MNAANIFITGPPGCGKTTLVRRLAGGLKNVSGFITEEINRKGERWGFAVTDIITGESGVLASVDQKQGPRVSKYRVDVAGFEKIAIPALEKKADLYVVDEIGKMEFFSEKFCKLLDGILRSDKKVLATVGKNFADQYKKYGKMVWLTRENFNEVCEKVKKELT